MIATRIGRLRFVGRPAARPAVFRPVAFAGFRDARCAVVLLVLAPPPTDPDDGDGNGDAS